MSLEKDKVDIKEKYDKYLQSTIGKPINKEEMAAVLAEILKEYAEIPSFEAVSAELLREGKYPAIRYTIRRKRMTFFDHYLIYTTISTTIGL